MNRNIVVVPLSIVLLACGSAEGEQSDSVTVTAREAPAVPIGGDTAPAGPEHCAAPPGGVRVGPDTVAGIPARLTIAEIRRFCPNARRDSVVRAGFSSPAVRFDFPGVSVWAVQSQYNDSLREDRSPDFWAARGDSLRFASGVLIPRTVGGLRAYDSLGTVAVEDVDNGDGPRIRFCSHPGLGIQFDFTSIDLPASDGVWPLAQLRESDTTRYRMVEQYADSIVLHRHRRRCGGEGQP